MGDIRRAKAPQRRGGAGTRRPRLRDSETEKRMLRAGMEFIAEHGFSLNVDQINMDALIEQADVSRTSSYRRWPTRDEFTNDLLLEIAKATELSGEIPGLVEALVSLDRSLRDNLDTAVGRHEMLIEVLRRVAEVDFLAMTKSSSWQAYTTLTIAYLGVRDNDVRQRVAEILVDTDHRFIQRRAEALERLTSPLGYRIDSSLVGGWYQLSVSLGALSTGMLIRATTDDSIAHEAVNTTAFGSSFPAPWTKETLSAVGLIAAAIEVDSQVDWTSDRIASLQGLLDDIPTAISWIQHGTSKDSGLKDVGL